jgi:hypothetical protein
LAGAVTPFWFPAAVSLVLGIVYLIYGEGRSVTKLVGAAVFGVAVYLQFFSRYSLAGLLLQVALGVCLALWLRSASPR